MIKNKLKFISVIFILITACSNDENISVQQEDNPIKPDKAIQEQKNTQQQPQKVVPIIQPTLLDVRQAFENALIRESKKFAEGPEKQTWLAQEYNRLNTISVSSCTPAPLGKPVVCNVIFSGSQLNGLNLLLTTSGWIIL